MLYYISPYVDYAAHKMSQIYQFDQIEQVNEQEAYYMIFLGRYVKFSIMFTPMVYM